MIGSLGSSSAMRPSGIPGHQLRPVQLRPQPSPSTHSPAAQVCLLYVLQSHPKEKKKTCQLFQTV